MKTEKTREQSIELDEKTLVEYQKRRNRYRKALRIEAGDMFDKESFENELDFIMAVIERAETGKRPNITITYAISRLFATRKA